MADTNEHRLTRIERLLAKISAQTTELHRLALLASEHQAEPPKPAKRGVPKKR
jgi:hypothetical protein